MAEERAAVRLVPRLYRFALRSWPRSARSRLGVEAEEVFAARWSAVRRSGRGRVRFVVRELHGAIAAGSGFRRDAARRRRQGNRGKAGRMTGMMEDLRFALRSLRRNPLFAVLVTLVLVLGIGANAAIFSVVNAVLLRPLPGAGPDRLVTIRESNPEFGWEAQTAAGANMLDWRERVSAFADVAAHGRVGTLTLTGLGEPELVRDVDVTGNFLAVIGVRPALGRTLRDEETWNTEPPVVVLSDGFWARRFGRDPDVLGRLLTLNGVSYEIVGVMPPGFTFPAEEVDLWRPMRLDPAARTAVWFRRAHWMEVVARLAPGVTLEHAEAELQTVVRQLSAEYPETNQLMGAHVHPLHAFLVQDVRLPLLLLQGAVLLLLLVACANAGNLVLVRAAGRRRELAVRAALGAGRGRIARLMLAESMVLSVLGGACGTVLGLLAVRALSGLMPATLPTVDAIALDARVLGFALAVSVLAGLAFGALPAVRVAQSRLSETLRDGGRGGTQGRSTLRAANALVVAEIAVALVLVLGAGLLIRSFIALRQVDPGFEIEDRIAAGVTLPSARYDSTAKVLLFYDRLLERVRATPGVVSAGMATGVPLAGTDFTSGFVVEGWPPDRFGAEVLHQRVTAGWLETMGIPVIVGRSIDATDRADTEPILVINETLQRQYFAGEDPIGRRIAFTRDPGAESVWWRIVGVVGDVHQDAVGLAPRIEVAQPVTQDVASSMAIFVHGTRPPDQLIDAVRSAVSELDPDIPLSGVRTVEEIYADSLRQDRFLLTLLGGFAALALVLAALGVYGVASQAAKRRTQEIGIRVALGANRGDVSRLILVQALRLAVTGVVLGLVGGVAATRVMESVLFGVVPTDRLTFLIVATTLGLVTVLASWLPARSATRVDPLVALRAE